MLVSQGWQVSRGSKIKFISYFNIWLLFLVSNIKGKRKLWEYKRPRRALLLLIIYFMGNCIQFNCFIVRMAVKSPFCLHSTLPLKCIGSRWNPVMLKPKDPLYPLGYHLSGLIQGIGSYLKTTKGCQARFFKDRKL